MSEAEAPEEEWVKAVRAKEAAAAAASTEGKATEGAGDSSPSKGKGKGKGKGGGIRGVRIHVRNLTASMTTEGLRGLFEGYGQIVSLEAKANDDGTCKGFGYVVFSNMEEATKAISESHDKEVNGKNIAVVLAENKDKGKGKDGGDGKGGGKGMKGKKGEQGTYAQPLYQYPYGYGMPGYGYGSPGYGYGYPYGMMPSYPYGGGYPGMMPSYGSYPGMMPYGYAGQGMPPPAPPKEEAPAGKGNRGNKESETSSAPAPAPDKNFDGTLKSISGKHGYGFIDCQEVKTTHKRDTYVEAKDMPDNVKAGDKLQFNIVLSVKGHPRAVNVTHA